jgi:hypothetical protein
MRVISKKAPLVPTVLCTGGVLRVPRQYIGTQTGLLGPGGDGVDCHSVGYSIHFLVGFHGRGDRDPPWGAKSDTR